MSLYFFDTDTLTLFERLHPVVVRNVFYHLADDIRVTSITVEEQLGGVVRLPPHGANTTAD